MNLPRLLGAGGILAGLDPTGVAAPLTDTPDFIGEAMDRGLFQFWEGAATFFWNFDRAMLNGAVQLYAWRRTMSRPGGLIGQIVTHLVDDPTIRTYLGGALGLALVLVALTFALRAYTGRDLNPVSLPKVALWLTLIGYLLTQGGTLTDRLETSRIGAGATAYPIAQSINAAMTYDNPDIPRGTPGSVGPMVHLFSYSTNFGVEGDNFTGIDVTASYLFAGQADITGSNPGGGDSGPPAAVVTRYFTTCTDVPNPFPFPGSTHTCASPWPDSGVTAPIRQAALGQARAGFMRMFTGALPALFALAQGLVHMLLALAAAILLTAFVVSLTFSFFRATESFPVAVMQNYLRLWIFTFMATLFLDLLMGLLIYWARADNWEALLGSTLVALVFAVQFAYMATLTVREALATALGRDPFPFKGRGGGGGGGGREADSARPEKGEDDSPTKASPPQGAAAADTGAGSSGGSAGFTPPDPNPVGDLARAELAASQAGPPATGTGATPLPPNGATPAGGTAAAGGGAARRADTGGATPAGAAGGGRAGGGTQRLADAAAGEGGDTQRLAAGDDAADEAGADQSLAPLQGAMNGYLQSRGLPTVDSQPRIGGGSGTGAAPGLRPDVQAGLLSRLTPGNPPPAGTRPAGTRGSSAGGSNGTGSSNGGGSSAGSGSSDDTAGNSAGNGETAPPTGLTATGDVHPALRNAMTASTQAGYPVSAAAAVVGATRAVVAGLQAAGVPAGAIPGLFLNAQGQLDPHSPGVAAVAQQAGPAAAAFSGSAAGAQLQGQLISPSLGLQQAQPTAAVDRALGQAIATGGNATTAAESLGSSAAGAWGHQYSAVQGVIGQSRQLGLRNTEEAQQFLSIARAHSPEALTSGAANLPAAEQALVQRVQTGVEARAADGPGGAEAGRQSYRTYLNDVRSLPTTIQTPVVPEVATPAGSTSATPPTDQPGKDSTS